MNIRKEETNNDKIYLSRYIDSYNSDNNDLYQKFSGIKEEKSELEESIKMKNKTLENSEEIPTSIYYNIDFNKLKNLKLFQKFLIEDNKSNENVDKNKKNKNPKILQLQNKEERKEKTKQSKRNFQEISPKKIENIIKQEV